MQPPDPAWNSSKSSVGSINASPHCNALHWRGRQLQLTPRACASRIRPPASTSCEHQAMIQPALVNRAIRLVVGGFVSCDSSRRSQFRRLAVASQFTPSILLPTEPRLVLEPARLLSCPPFPLLQSSPLQPTQSPPFPCISVCCCSRRDRQQSRVPACRKWDVGRDNPTR